MNEKQMNNFQSEDCGEAVCRTTSDAGDPAHRKPAFVTPELICHGTVANLTSKFGGSFQPNYHPNPTHSNPFQQKD